MQNGQYSKQNIEKMEKKVLKYRILLSLAFKN